MQSYEVGVASPCRDKHSAPFPDYPSIILDTSIQDIHVQTSEAKWSSIPSPPISTFPNADPGFFSDEATDLVLSTVEWSKTREMIRLRPSQE